MESSTALTPAPRGLTGLTVNQRLCMLFLLIYVGVKFIAGQKLDALGAYAGYVFEVLFIGAVAAFAQLRLGAQEWKNLKLPLEKPLMGALLGSVLLGWCVYEAGEFIPLVIPFDLSSTETILFLLLISPILEEVLFRGAIWELLGGLGLSPRLVLWITSLGFSYAHFFAWWSLPVELHAFVIYQAIYALILGVACGTARLRTKGLVAPVLLHFLFNLGFYIRYLM